MSQIYLVIAYDTPSDKRRLALFKLLKRFGERKQYSLFEARLNPAEWAKLKGQILALIEPEQDNLAIYFLAPEALGRTLRVGNAAVSERDKPDLI